MAKTICSRARWVDLVVFNLSYPPKAEPAARLFSGIRKLINDIEHSIFDNIPIGGATWVPETAVQYKGEYISEKFEMNETRLQLEAFVKYIRQGRAPEKLTREGYNASIWSILGEEAIDKGLKLEMPKKYII